MLSKLDRRILWSFNCDYEEKILAFITTPKRVGSSWLRRTFDALFKLDRKMEPRGFDYRSAPRHIGNIKSGLHIFKTHCIMPSELLMHYPGCKCVVLLRDIRDSLTSRYFMENYHMRDKRGQKIPEFNQEHFSKFLVGPMGLDHIEESLMYFSEQEMYGEHAIWYDYEELIEETAGAMHDIATYLTGQKIQEFDLLEAIGKGSFKAKTGKEIGDGDNARFNRKGIVGDYKNYFTVGDNKIFLDNLARIAKRLNVKEAYLAYYYA